MLYSFILSGMNRSFRPALKLLSILLPAPFHGEGTWEDLSYEQLEYDWIFSVQNFNNFDTVLYQFLKKEILDRNNIGRESRSTPSVFTLQPKPPFNPAMYSHSKVKFWPRSRKLSSIYQSKISLNTVLYFWEENPRYMSYIQMSCLPFYLFKNMSYIQVSCLPFYLSKNMSYIQVSCLPFYLSKNMSYIQVSCLPFYLSKKRSFFLQAYRKLNPFSLFSLLQNRHKNVKEFYNFIVFIILGAKMHQHGKI